MCSLTYLFNSLADYIAAANHRLDESKEQNQSILQGTSSGHLSTAQMSQTSLNHNHNAAEIPLTQKVVPVDTSEVDTLIEKFKSEVEVCIL